MATIDWDVVEGSRLSHSGRGWEKIRIARVYGLDGDEDAREYQALVALPGRGVFHPSIPLVRIDEKKVRAISDDHVEIEVVYRSIGYGQTTSDNTEDDETQIEIGGTIEMARTDQDKDGNPLEVHYSGEPSNDFPAVPKRREEVDFGMPMFSVRYRRLNNYPPDQEAADFVGKVNSTTFAGRPPRTWLMQRITGVSGDGGQTYDTTYEMAYNRRTWAVRLLVLDPETGKKPVDATEGDGLFTYDIYPEADFTQIL